MQIEQEIELMHEQKLKTVKFKWLSLFGLSQILWLIFFAIFSSMPEQVEQVAAPLPEVNKDYIRLELPLSLYFPAASFPQKIVVHHSENKTLLSRALLQGKSRYKKGHFVVDLPSVHLKKLLPLPHGKLEAYPDKTIARKRRSSHEIIF